MLTALVAAVALATAPAPVLSVQGGTLHWTSTGSGLYRLMAKAASRTFTDVTGTEYPGVVGTTYRVRAKNESPWSNAVTVEAPKEEEPPPPPNGAGKVKQRLDAKSAFDSYPLSWFGKLSRLLAYPTAGDRYTSTVPTLAYHDAWTSWGSSGATHVSEYVAKANRDKGAGYAGQFMDDVNFAGGNRAGTPKQYADLIEAVRAAVGPTGVIEINAQFWDIWPLIKAGEPEVLRALSKVNVVTKEFNVDPTSGINTGPKYAEFMQYVDYLAGKGIHVTIAGDSSHNTTADKEYALATYLLLNDGGDFIGFSEQGPGKEWAGLMLDLGDATGPRERLMTGVWKRAFTGGMTLVVEPGAATQTINLPKPMRRLDGTTVTQVTLAAAHGAPLLN